MLGAGGGKRPAAGGGAQVGGWAKMNEPRASGGPRQGEKVAPPPLNRFKLLRDKVLRRFASFAPGAAPPAGAARCKFIRRGGAIRLEIPNFRAPRSAAGPGSLFSGGRRRRPARYTSLSREIFGRPGLPSCGGLYRRLRGEGATSANIWGFLMLLRAFSKCFLGTGSRVMKAARNL